MRVLDENRALKQQLAHAEGKLMSSEQEGEALREMLAADRAAMRSQQAEMHRKITALELQVAELLNSRECLREEVGIVSPVCTWGGSGGAQCGTSKRRDAFGKPDVFDQGA